MLMKSLTGEDRTDRRRGTGTGTDEFEPERPSPAGREVPVAGSGRDAILAALNACQQGPAVADFIGLNPLHARLTAAPERCSPYEPSNRRFLNPLYIAVDQVAGFVGQRQRKARRGEKQKMLAAFKAAGLLTASSKTESDGKGLPAAVHRLIARTPSMLMAVRLADLTDEKRPTNVPSTKDSYPNWKPKLSATIAELNAVFGLTTIISAVTDERAVRRDLVNRSERHER
ncbi:hypothetical protein GCM10010924_39870 [Rhizobium wenxiniae]|uniref:4-alpha-glucanotransferase n=2 Tax=Rhizobium wenxiniae TaxID=1737357 RepID=A0A7W9YA20_9HYPH|nr:4-alpha-glucanotransferase [Rhizobium wenxiniae]MBB6164602.1 4-alpha-glucanotransferase [Rhizobium wenxiniae]GGG07141.1 hypothetical protein GCM10010924_39870 [Rhizobium wenxiniae]